MYTYSNLRYKHKRYLLKYEFLLPSSSCTFEMYHQRKYMSTIIEDSCMVTLHGTSHSNKVVALDKGFADEGARASSRSWKFLFRGKL